MSLPNHSYSQNSSSSFTSSESKTSALSLFRPSSSLALESFDSLLSLIQNNAISVLDLESLSIRDWTNSACSATLRGHGGSVIALTTLKTGEIVSGSGDYSIKIWDPSSWSCIRTLNGHMGTIFALTTLKTGEIASGSGDYSIKIWNPSSGDCINTLDGHTKAVYALTTLKTGELVSGGLDKCIKIWDTSSGNCIRTLWSGHVNNLMILQSGELVVAERKGCISIRNPISGAHIGSFKDSSLFYGTWSVTTLKSEEFVYGDENTSAIEIWNKTWNDSERKCIKTLYGHSGGVTALTTLRSGEFASGSLDKTIKIWDASSGRYIKTLTGHTDTVSALTTLQSGEMVSGSYDGSIKIWKAPQKKLKLTHNHLKEITQALKKNTSITTLSFPNDPDIKDDVIDLLISVYESGWFSSANKTLTTLDLRGTGITKRGVSKLQAVIQNEKLSVRILTGPKPAEEKKPSEQEAKIQTERKLEEARKKQGEDAKEAQKKLETQQKEREEKIALQNQKTESKESKEQKSPSTVSGSSSGGSSSSSASMNSGASGSAGSESMNKMSSSEIQQMQAAYLIPYTALTFGEVLGEGGFGAVYKGTYNDGEVAIKKLTVKKMTAATEEEFKNETAIMARLKHPNVVTLFGYTVGPSYCMVMELMHGSLYNVLHNNQELPWDVRTTIAKDIIAGLLQLHEAGILHRDLKSLNVLLSSNMRAKLADFGLATVKRETNTTTRASAGSINGTVQWMAPELFVLGPKYSQATDIFACAMVFWELVTRQIPYADTVPQVIIAEVKNGNREELPSHCPTKFSSLIKFCWDQDPKRRPTAKEISAYLRSEAEEFKPSSTDTQYRGNLESHPVDNLNSLRA